MTLKTIVLSIILFVVIFIITLVLLFPVQVVIEQFEEYIPETIHVHSPKGTVSKGSFVIADATRTTSLPVQWSSCFIDILHPIGLCFALSIQGVKANFAAQPWSLSQDIDIYQLIVSSELSDLAAIHPSLSALSLVSGRLLTNIEKLTISIPLRRITEIVGQVQIADVRAIGLNFGIINMSLDTQIDEEIKTIIIALEGGEIDNIQMVGSGTIDEDGILKMRLILRSKNPTIEQQLAVLAKKRAENEYEYAFSRKIF